MDVPGIFDPQAGGGPADNRTAEARYQPGAPFCLSNSGAGAQFAETDRLDKLLHLRGEDRLDSRIMLLICSPEGLQA